MYDVIIILDENRGRSYYHSYTEDGDESGNIRCAELPPYQDINKARSCWWNEGKWSFDRQKHAEIVAEQAAEKDAEEQARREAEAAPDSNDLMLGLMELADNLSAVMDAVSELASEVAAMKGGV